MGNFKTGSAVALLVGATAVIVTYLVIFLDGTSSDEVELDSIWTWTCMDQGSDSAACVREVSTNSSKTTMNRCQLTCGKHSVLWPAPLVTPTIGTEVSRFTTSNVQTLVAVPPEVEELMNTSISIFREKLNMIHPDYDHIQAVAPWTTPPETVVANHVLVIQLSVSSTEDRLTLSTDESYSLNITSTKDQTVAEISGVTFFGVRHGLETLSQLIIYEELNNALQIINSVVINNDRPAFPHRGLSMDTSRSFFPIADIKKTIDAMSGSKLNTFHWHITDSYTFPIVMESLPNMHRYGAYSTKKVYYISDIQDVVEYARVRGVRVLPELDAPAHVGYGWQWGPEEGLGNLTTCLNWEPWWMWCQQPPCGQLNIANEEMYNVLGAVYRELISAFGPIDMFHYGGDEVSFGCWNATEEIREWMLTVGNKTLSEEAYHLQWSIFQERAYNLLTEANMGNEVKGVIWTSSLTDNEKTEAYLDKDKYIIQIWSLGSASIIPELLEKGYNLIFSNYDAWYLDCGLGAWVGDGRNWCSPYKEWQTVYDNRPYYLVNNSAYNDQILGGEAALWTEQTDSQSLDTRLWPRLAALGERLWSNFDHGWEPALYRMLYQRERLVQRGVAADVIQPEWCFQNQGKCPGPED